LIRDKSESVLAFQPRRLAHPRLAAVSTSGGVLQDQRDGTDPLPGWLTFEPRQKIAIRKAQGYRHWRVSLPNQMSNSPAKQRIVISAVNLTEMGPLSILQDCLSYMVAELSHKFEIIALVNRKGIIDLPGIRYYEFPSVKRSWLRRIYYEYFGFRGLSKELKAFLWFSLYDMSANVVAERRAVYCHNPAPFYPLRLKEVFVDIKFALFNLFYIYLYGINIKSNDFVVVQQDWLRKEFSRRFGALNIVVSHPHLGQQNKSDPSPDMRASPGASKVFFYPAYPRMHKNMEVIGAAVELLIHRGIPDFTVYLTMTGTENRYAKKIVSRFGHLSQIRFVGLLTRQQVYEHYQMADCLIFPSKLETWGLPITEFRQFKKPMLVANCRYAQETIGGYEKAALFDPDDPVGLADQMERALLGRLEFETGSAVEISPPFSRSWGELFSILLAERG
jgi:glycosyltransferase involved in cell wall biosynthesis